ncbi:MAG: glycosyltransferase family 4 protein [Deltaproteobacteria bacterium]|nr:glycosyltransferase family 4 protein [Deltaproteobacteria bacterium]
MNVIFVNYHDFTSPSGMHIFHLANGLARLGVRCVTYNGGKAETVTRYGKPLFRAYDKRLSPRRLVAETGVDGKDTLIHCWTPREISRLLVRDLTAVLDAPVVIHMEDHEEAITRANLAAVPEEKKDTDEIWQPGGPLFGSSHPERSRAFLDSAAGYTCIIERLLEFKPDHVPGHVFWPSCEPEVFDIPPQAAPGEKERWGIGPNEKVLFYPGNVHPNNFKEVVQLYLAAGRLRAAGLPLRLIKFGSYPKRVMELIATIPAIDEVIVDLTEAITPAAIPDVLRAVDYLVQPGADTPFNQYRFPCKLPLFMASGRPVILPDTNLGKHLADGENCLLLREGSADEIAERLLELVRDPVKAEAIGAAGRAFAKERFSWAHSAKGLKAFYETVLRSAAKGA